MTVINEAYFQNLTDQINSVDSCAALQNAANIILPSIQAQITAASAQLAKVQPILALLTPPSSPDDIINWIQGLIDNVISPLAAPAAIYEAQLAALAAGLLEVTAAINDKANSFTDCEVST